MVFGDDRDRGLGFENAQIVIREFAAGDMEAAKAAGVMAYDSSNYLLATALAKLPFPEFPKPLGVFYKEQRPCFDSQQSERKLRLVGASAESQGATADQRLSETLRNADTWSVS